MQLNDVRNYLQINNIITVQQFFNYYKKTIFVNDFPIINKDLPIPHGFIAQDEGSS